MALVRSAVSCTGMFPLYYLVASCSIVLRIGHTTYDAGCGLRSRNNRATFVALARPIWVHIARLCDVLPTFAMCVYFCNTSCGDSGGFIPDSTLMNAEIYIFSLLVYVRDKMYAQLILCAVGILCMYSGYSFFK